MENKLYKKTIIWNGDSICAGEEISGNWAERIAKNNTMISKNYGVGGGTITEGIEKTANDEIRHCVSTSLEKMYEEFPHADYVVLEGGTNDADLIEICKEPAALGCISKENDFSGNYDRNTFCGALESVFYRATKYWYGKKIVFIIAQKMGMEKESFRVRRLYFDKAEKICKKWGIPYIDLWNTCPLNPYLSWMYNSEKTPDANREENICMYVDGQHLTARGYDYTAEIIENFLKII